MTELEANFRRFKAEGETLAGGLGDFQQRAGAYYQLYKHSNGNFVFPLIAAHGALWGAGHMQRGMSISRFAASISGMPTSIARYRMAMVNEFTDTLKDINRQVLVMTYTAYQMTRLHATAAELENYIPARLVVPLGACHDARRNGWSLNAAARRALFEAAFRWEQDHVVGPRLEAAIPKLDWPIIRGLSLRPPIGFSYFGKFQYLWFKDFSDREERIKHGLKAYDIAIRKGLEYVEGQLGTYGANDTVNHKQTARCGQGCTS